MTLAGTLERLEATDVAALDAGGVSAGLRDVARLKGFVASVEACLARRADALSTSGSGLPADELLGRSQSMSRREAQRAARRAETLGRFPAMSHQLGSGRIGAEHADALAGAASKLDEDDRAVLFGLDAELATHAASSTPEQFRRHVDRVIDQLAADRGLERAERQRRSATLSTGINRDTGMYWLRAELAPEDGVRVFTALDAELAALVTSDRPTAAAEGPEGQTAHSTPRRDQLAAQALVDLATSAHRSQRPGRSEMLLAIDHHTLIGDLHEHSICEYADGTALPVATARRLACDAEIYPVVLGGDGVVRCRRLRRRVRSLRDPPPRRLGPTPRPHRPRPADSCLHPPPSPRPRRRVAARTRPDHPRTDRAGRRRNHHLAQPPRPRPADEFRPGAARATTTDSHRDGTDRRGGGLMVHARASHTSHPAPPMTAPR